MEVPASHLRFPLFDSLRGIAAISILVLHVSMFTIFADGAVYNNYFAGFVVHLDVGVPFFFVLSGFLLYRPFVAARIEGRDRPLFSGYGWRRFLRIAPAYWAMLAISAILPGMYGAFTGNWWVYWGLLQNLPVYTPSGTCAIDSYRCASPVAWTLAIEVMFYAMLPLFVIGLAWVSRMWRPQNWLLPELAAISCLALISLPIQAATTSGDLHQILIYSPIGTGLWFALGLGLASVSVWVQRENFEPGWVWFIRMRGWVCALAGLVIYMIVSFWVLPPLPGAARLLADIDPSKNMIQYIAFGAVAFLVILPATFGWEWDDPYRRFLRHRVTTWLGLISYGIFLWQFPSLIFVVDYLDANDWWPQMDFLVTLVLTFALTVGCAATSYYLLERPLMAWGRRTFSRPKAEPVPAEPGQLSGGAA